jgi:GNAT superfamily N-acetyltransferase
MLYHGRSGTDYDIAFWQALHALQDRIWPQMSARIEVARKLGVHWETETTPFAWIEEKRALAHVGVIAHPLRLLGEDRVVAGIHAVCVDPEARGRGLGRRCMEAAVAWIDERFNLAKLSTTIPAFYDRWGFSAVPTHRFVAQRTGGGGPARPATLDDTTRLHALLSVRTPTSDIYATREPGWLPIIDLALQARLPHGVLVVPQRDFLIVARQHAEVLHLDDVVGPELPGLEEVLAAIPFRFERVIYNFTPDRLDPGARPEPVPVEAGVLLVRGAWPELPPFGVSSVWEH